MVIFDAYVLFLVIAGASWIVTVASELRARRASTPSRAS
jgi:hypothetical protein